LEGLERVDCENFPLDALHDVEQHRQRAPVSDGTFLLMFALLGSHLFVLMLKDIHAFVLMSSGNPFCFTIAKSKNTGRIGDLNGV